MTTNVMMKWRDDLGHFVVRKISFLFQSFFMIYAALRAGFVSSQKSYRSVIQVIATQVYFTGVQAMPLLFLLAFIMGSFSVIQASMHLSKVGGAQMIGSFLITFVVRELGPLITAILVIARSGTAVASELGSMKVHREVDALISMGINPLSYIVFPRLLGGVVSLMCLSIYFVLIALMGGFFTAHLSHGLSWSYYIQSLAQALSVSDIFIFIIKNIFNGMIIFFICCYYGLQVKKSSHEVPQVTTRAVMNSISFVLVFNIIFTLLIYLESLRKMGVL